jgi:hypothetical protein
MSDDTYEGWTNRETWAIQLHLSNNEGDYRQMREQAEEYVEESEERDDPYAVGLMADYIKEWTEEVFDLVVNPEDGPAGEAARMFVSDVGSWWRADFYEIAEHWIDEARESMAS